MLKILFFISVIFLNLWAFETQFDEVSLKKEIGRMLVVGFENAHVDDNSAIIQQIKKYNLGGVILFDRFYKQKDKIKNIDSPQQLKLLTSKLQQASVMPLLIGTDQEGGRVQRMKPIYGFENTMSAQEVAKEGLKKASVEYEKLAKTLKNSGINTNFAPVVDLAVNPNNSVIYQLQRAYSSDPKIVSKYAKVFIHALQKEGVISVLKHFPHGSSLEIPTKVLLILQLLGTQKSLNLT